MKSENIGKPLGTDLDKLRALADEDIVIDEDLPYDPDDPDAVDEFWKDAVLVREGGVAAVRAGLAARGQAGDPRKVLIAVRYSLEVVEFFMATGSGWQARMDDALREWVKAHPEKRALIGLAQAVRRAEGVDPAQDSAASASRISTGRRAMTCK